MEAAKQLKRGISRQLSGGSVRRSGRFSFKRNLSFDPRLSNVSRFSFGRQSSLDPNRGTRSPAREELTVPENLDSTMQLLFLACQGDTKGLEELLENGVDVNSIDLDGRTALHIAACEGHIGVVKLLLSWRANIDARDRWGTTAAADARYYGNVEVYSILKARGAKVPDTYQIAKWNGTKVSVKILDRESYSDPDRVNAFKYELNLLQKARHPNVIQFVGAVTQNIPMMIVLEYHPKGDLGSYLHKKGRLQPHKVIRYALEIARNILLDCGGQLKVGGFGLVNLSKISPNKAKLADSKAQIDNLSLYMAPEVYRDEIFDRSIDAFSFGLILYEMIEGAPAFHPKGPEEAARMICLDGLRPLLKNKSKGYPPDVKELIEECWDPDPVVRPTFSEIIIRLDKVYATCLKQGRWKDTFKLPWYAPILSKIMMIHVPCS
ncbi:serine threonine protein kinase [Musa troglodytarum]|uniref:Serine threonine protein kinase n=1 Tax=Musa troglodytarum TaxID=320322 RepID=A0A9E7L3Y1_9LILI|nr:serine threonine protein kinase [Musa troglodytarum]